MNKPLTNRNVLDVATPSSSADSGDMNARLLLALEQAGEAVNRERGWTAEGLSSRNYFARRGLLCPKCGVLPARQIGGCCSLCEPVSRDVKDIVAERNTDANQVPVDNRWDRAIRNIQTLGSKLNGVPAKTGGSLTVCGVGINPGQCTFEAAFAIAGAEKVFYFCDDSRWVSTLNPRAEHIGVERGDDLNRMHVYEAMIERSLAFARRCHTVVCYYGSATLGVYPARVASERGAKASPRECCRE